MALAGARSQGLLRAGTRCRRSAQCEAKIEKLKEEEE